MLGPEFLSCWQKLNRAEEHLDALKKELRAWHDTDAYSVIRDYDPSSGRNSLIVNIKGIAPFNKLALIAGDCAHNLRCSLDHLVYALAVRDSGSNPPPNFKVLQFPIAASPEDFAKQQHRIASLGSASQTFIENVQPYHTAHATLPHILLVLNEFDNMDKHRLVHLTYSHNAGGKISFVGKFDGPPTVEWINKPLESGHEFVRFTTNPPQRDVEYKYEASFCIAVGHISGPTGRVTSPLESVMRGMMGEVRKIMTSVV